MTPIISAEELKPLLGKPGVIVLDASWYLPAMCRDPEAEFAEAHVPGAQRFDFDGEVCDPDLPLPHMLPTPGAFEAAVRGLGIGAESHVVIYDGAGLFAAPRAWWMFRVMGHDAVQVLDGGLPAWHAAGGPVEEGPPGAPPAVTGPAFVARPVPTRLADAAEVLAHLDAADTIIVDARSAERFAGRAPEPRAGLRSGHMPGAANLPFDEVLEGGRLKGREPLQTLFATRGADGARRVITSCGSGVTASVLALAYEVAFDRPAAVYDGSWSEWGDEGRGDLPVVAED